MLRIRLSRVGKKKQPHYRVVVADIEAKRDGRIVERIGYYNPLTDPGTYEVNEERALYWLSVGAQPTESVRHLLERHGTLDRLARLRKGESLEALVAEYKGEAVAEAAVEAEEQPAAPVAEEAAGEGEVIAEAVEEAAGVPTELDEEAAVLAAAGVEEEE